MPLFDDCTHASVIQVYPGLCTCLLIPVVCDFSVLLMKVEPDGPLYELPILGSVVTERTRRQTTNIVLSDRCFIYFGGVGVGKSL